MADINVSFADQGIEVSFEWSATWPRWPSWSAYTHNQGISLATWTIVHNTGVYPAWITVVDAGGTNIVLFHITYIDINTVILEFSGAMTWVAYLS